MGNAAIVFVVGGTTQCWASLLLYGSARSGADRPYIRTHQCRLQQNMAVRRASYFLRNVSAEAQSIQFDELRIGSDWASVTPEPSSLLLLASGTALLSARRRRV